jgi:beta-N-acetylglucosaminidase
MRVVFRSFLVVLLLIGIFQGKAAAVEAAITSAQTELTVISTKLPVYRSFEELSDFRIHTSPDYVRYKELSFNAKVTVISEKDYAAEVRMADGSTGWVHKGYLSSDLKKQTWWLVKEGRNLREGPGTSYAKVGSVPDHAKVIVLDYNSATNFYKIQTADGQQGWIYGFYQDEKDGVFVDYKAGSNVIPFEFEKEGTVTNRISIFTPLSTKADVTANELNQFINYKTKNTATLMTGMGSAYLQAQKVTGLNAIYLMAHSGLESKWGTSDIVKAKNNFYGIGAEDLRPAEGAYDYSTPSNGINAGAIWINEGYVNRAQYKSIGEYPFSQPTLDNMRFNSTLHQYSTDEAWASKIAQIANEFFTYTFKPGWKNRDGKWYYYNADGNYKIGWYNVNGKWYYSNPSGVMLTGWQVISGKWYYLNPSGDMKTGWLYSGGKWYFLQQSGVMKTGWLSTGDKWYYLNSGGVMQTGWIKLSGKWYYLYKDGHMAANTTVGGYRLGKDGAML